MLDLTKIRGAVRSEGGVTRRLFLAYGSALAALPALASRATAADRKVTFAADPFSLGVASGDPDATGVVLWTKLAPKPADPDGGARLLGRYVRVYQLAAHLADGLQDG